MRHLKLAAIGVATILSALAGNSRTAVAQGASFGCKVLLCAASQNPSWHGVSYCVPPMTKLIAIREVHPGYWPICAETGTGKPGRQNYQDCPEGWTETMLQSTAGRNGADRGRPGCRRQVSVECPRSRGGRNSASNINQISRSVTDGHVQCLQTETMARHPRTDPHFFDIQDKSTGKISRHWFNLNH